MSDVQGKELVLTSGEATYLSVAIKAALDTPATAGEYRSTLLELFQRVVGKTYENFVASESDPRFQLTIVGVGELTNAAMSNQAMARELLHQVKNGAPVDSYRAIFTEGGNQAKVVFFPNQNIGGITEGEEVRWTESTSARDVVQRYLDKRMAPPVGSSQGLGQTS